MAIESGARFGPYEVAEQIGSGGMGEVWLARDTALNRDVAIKVLPQAFVEDADRLSRFQREAEILASLNHANIATIYGLEKIDDQTVIVMELVEGPTLADRIQAGPIPPDEAMGIALQVISALEAAHAKQIVHRDLKPANVKVRDDGTVKVLDFGISKPIDPTAVSGGSVVATPAVTQTGVILGTAAYMSPEQARGKFVDQRTDIWAFGCLLFEMLTGQPAFGGEDVMLTLARVLDRDTDLSAIPNTISPAVRHTLKLCLEKNPDKRIADVRDVRLALEGMFESALPYSSEARAVQPFWKRAAMPAAALIAGIAITALAAWLLRPPPTVNRWMHPLGPESSFESNSVARLLRNAVAVSPDGRSFVYAGPDGLYLREMDDPEARLIPGSQWTEVGIPHIFFSRDGDWLAYIRNGPDGLQLMKIQLGGGRAAPVAALERGFTGGTWGADDRILFATLDGIFSVSAQGGPVQTVLEAGENEFYRRPQLLPDGDSILVSRVSEPPGGDGLAIDDATEIVVVSLAERTVKQTLFSGGGDALYVKTGHILYAYGDDLYARAFDPDSLAVSDEVLLEQGVRRGLAGTPLFFARFDVADDGTLAYLVGGLGQAVFGSGPPIALVWVDPDSGAEAFFSDTADRRVGGADLYDGELILVEFELPDARYWLWAADADRGDPVLEPVCSGVQQPLDNPIWVNRERGVIVMFGDDLARQHPDAPCAPERLSIPDHDEPLIVSGLTPERDQLLVTYWLDAGDDEGDSFSSANRVGLLPIEPDENGDYSIEPLINRESVNAQIDPQGEYIIYESGESGVPAIYIDCYPDPGSCRFPITDANGGRGAIWTPEGDAVIYQRGSDDMIVKVAIDRTDEPRPGERMELFPDQDYRFGPRGWGLGIVAIDGDGRLLMHKNMTTNEGPAAADGSGEATEAMPEIREIMVIQGFGEILKGVRDD